MVNGFFDVENRLDYLTANGDILPTLNNLIPWEEFRSELEVIYDHERKSNAGRRSFDVVIRKGCRGRPLISWEKQRNRTRSKTRSRIEHVSGAMVQRAGNVILRPIGMKTAEVKLGLRNFAYNMDRYCTLMIQAA